MAKTINLILGALFLLIGLFYVALPHSIHLTSGLGFGLVHGIHILIGLVLIIIGVILFWLRKK